MDCHSPLQLIEPWLHRSVKAAVANVDSHLSVAFCGSWSVPVGIGASGNSSCYLDSMVSGVRYLEDLAQGRPPSLSSMAQRLGLRCARALFQMTQIDPYCTLNQQLISSPQLPPLTAGDLQQGVAALVQRYPSHAILLRGLHEQAHGTLLQQLPREVLRVATRHVMLWDPHTLPGRKLKDLRREWKHYAHLEVLPPEAMRAACPKRLQTLYRSLFLNKYSLRNPDYTEEWFAYHLHSYAIQLYGLRYEGQLVGCIGLRNQGGELIDPIIGYDTTLPTSLGLYRALSALALQEALSLGIPFNMSSGAETFKGQRGAVPVQEWMLVWCRHLPFRRQIPWHVMAACPLRAHR